MNVATTNGHAGGMAPPRPTTEAPRFDAIPAALKEKHQWCLWRYEFVDGKWTKTPWQAARQRAKSNDQRTWIGYEAAVERFQRAESYPPHLRFDGVGFFTSAGDDIVGGDLDNARDPETGEPAEWSVPILERFAETYIEVSPSGTGFRFFARGQKPGKLCRRPFGNGKVELYGKTQYLTVTGRRAGQAADVTDRAEEIGWLYRDVFGEAQKSKVEKLPLNPAEPLDIDDEALLKLARESKHGEKFGRAWEGNVADFDGDESRADYWVACRLAFFCGGPDAARVERLMRGSGLARDKWDSQRGESTYLAETVARAVENTKEFYKPPRRKADRLSVQSAEQIEAEASSVRQVTNGHIERTEEGSFPYPKHLSQIAAEILAVTGGFPKRTGGVLFAESPDGRGVRWLESPPSLAALVGERSDAPPVFHKSPGFHSPTEIFEHLKAHAEGFDGVEEHPHEPPMPRVYYACETPEPGDGRHLEELLDRFSFETETDRHLGLAFFATPLWGGDGGTRPGFLVTSRDGRGSGKTTMVKMAGELYGGIVELRASEEAPRILNRLLSADAMTKRITLLDNVKSPKFSWADLEGLITSPVLSGHRLHVGEGRRPNVLTWCVTLNGASLSTDLAQRVVILNLRRPTYSGDWAEQTREFLRNHRRELIGDLIGFLRRDRRPLARFSRWGSWENDVLRRLPDPAAAQRLILDRQGEANVEAEEAELVADYFRDRLHELDYDTDAERVFLPNTIAAAWFNAALGQHNGTSKVTRALKQLSDESPSFPVTVSPSRKGGRGFVWVGPEASPSATARHDLEHQIEIKRGHQGGRFAYSGGRKSWAGDASGDAYEWEPSR